MLEIQKFLQSNSLDHLEKKFGIISKRDSGYPNLVLLKYNQISSPMHERIVQECRGIILDQDDNWKVISRAFDKFFNYGEVNAAKIDWNSAKVQEKLDGSLMTLYFYDGKWRVQSSGSPNASGNVGEEKYTFAEYFWETADKCGLKLPDVKKLETFESQRLGNFCFSFELTGPKNRIITLNSESKITLIGARALNIGELYPDTFDLNIPQVKQFSISNIEDILKSFNHISPLQQEGYVVVDKDFNRIKIKHPKYVLLHHMKDGFSDKNCVEIIRNGEISELTTHFPEYQKIFDSWLSRFSQLKLAILTTWFGVSRIEEQKEFALTVKKFPYSGILFCLKNGKIKSIEEGLQKIKIEYLMELLNGYK